MIKVPLWFDDYCVTWSPAERILRHISSIPCRPVRACSFFSPLQLLRGAAGGGLLRLLLATAGAAAHAAGGGQHRALHNAAEDVVGGERELTARFIYETAALARVYEVLSGA